MRTTVQGRVVGYDEYGDGMPLVLIHGFPLNRFIWEAQWDELSSSAHVIAPDLRGFGESQMPATDPTIETYAADVRALLDVLGVHQPAVIAGLSMGGYIALAYLRRYPERVAALILANTRAGADSAQAKEGRDQNIALACEKGAAAIAEALLPKMLSPQSSTNGELVEQARRIMQSASVPGIVGALAAMRDRPDATATLREFTLPTLIITGADDQLIPVAESEALARAARKGRLVVLPAAGHLSCLEQPAAFNRALQEFLQVNRE